MRKIPVRHAAAYVCICHGRYVWPATKPTKTRIHSSARACEKKVSFRPFPNEDRGERPTRRVFTLLGGESYILVEAAAQRSEIH